MGDSGLTTATVERVDGVVRHDISGRDDIERVYRGEYSVRAYQNRSSSVSELFREAVAAAPQREALVLPEVEERYTYAELDNRVRSVAGGLAAVGVGRGDCVSFMLPNRAPFVETFLACQHLGAVAVPINTRVAAPELGYLLADTDPVCAVIDERYADLLADDAVSPPKDTFVVGGAGGYESYGHLLDSGDDVNADDVDDEHAPASVLYTSGTTGDPKGCVASHFNLVNGAINWRVAFDTGEALRVLATVPLFHVAGLTANLLHAIGNTGTTVVLDEFDAETFLRTVAGEDVQYLLAVPSQYVLVRETADPEAYDLSNWEIAAYGGAPMDERTIGRLREAFPGVKLCDAYGTTETVGGLVTMCPDEYTDDHSESIGLPTHPVELTVVGEDGEPVGQGEVGELAVRGPIIVDRYLGKPEETAEAFRDGWHYTGDLAAIDADGFVELKGRSDDKVVRGGKNIYTLEIEEALLEHDDVIEASATGYPDDVLGERVYAAVVPKPGRRVTEEQLRAVCERNLADYKVPELFGIRDEFPLNAGGKVLKHELLPEPLRHGIRAGRT